MDARKTAPTKPLWLTREEAFNLLELAVASAADLGAGEEAALRKLGDLCRAFFRDEPPPRPSAGEACESGRRPGYASTPTAARSRAQRSTPRRLIVTRAW